MSSYIYKKVTETRVGQRDKAMWLRRYGLFELVQMMEMLSFEYGMAWAEHWKQNLDKPAWLKKAMAHTFMKLSEEDKEQVRENYELFLWYDRMCDMCYMVKCEYLARCYILDRFGRRVMWDGQYQTTGIALIGETPKDAILQLNTNAYEFIEWI